MQIYSNQIEVILETEDKMKAIRHDMKHHLNELKILALKNQNKDVERYITSMQDYIDNPNELVDSGNIDVDSLLNYSLRNARAENIVVHTNVLLPQEIYQSFDINIILGNLLENAIEATRQTEEKILNVEAILKKGILKITVENSYQADSLLKSDEDGQNLITTKADKAKHGIGLKNVKKIVEKYNGTIEKEIQNQLFTIRVLLYMP